MEGGFFFFIFILFRFDVRGMGKILRASWGVPFLLFYIDNINSSKCFSL